MKVLVTLSSFAQYSDEPLKKLKAAGLTVGENPYQRKLSVTESLQLYQPDIAGVIAGTETINREVLEQAKALKVISRCGSGIDNVDLDAAKEKGIAVYRTSIATGDAVSELTVGLILACLRFIGLADRKIRANEWVKPMGYLLKNKTVGIVGLGAIGKRTVELLSAFGVNFLAHDLKADDAFGAKYAIKFTGLNELMKSADIVCLHLALNEHTRGLIGKKLIAAMKKDAILVNTCRGEVLDEAALYDSLKNKSIAGAGLDVFAQEPYQGRLCELDNVILTSHIGSYAREIRILMENEAVDNLIKALKG